MLEGICDAGGKKGYIGAVSSYLITYSTQSYQKTYNGYNRLLAYFFGHKIMFVCVFRYIMYIIYSCS